MAVDFKQYESDLRAEHTALTEAFEAQQKVAEAEWTKYEQAKTALAAFRAQYGRVLKALDAGAVEVKDGRETVTIGAEDVGTVNLEG